MGEPLPAAVVGELDELDRPPWLAALDDQQLAALVKQLDAAVRAAVELLPDDTADVVHAAAQARLELRRRRARHRIAAARAALAQSGWTA